MEDLEDALIYAERTVTFWHALEADLLSRRRRTLRLHYEDFASAPEATLRRVAVYLGLPAPSQSVMARMLSHAAQSAPSEASRRCGETMASRLVESATLRQRQRLRFCYLKQENDAWWRRL